MRRLERRGQAGPAPLLGEGPKRVGHEKRVGRIEEVGPSPDFRRVAEVSEGVDGETWYVPLAPVNGRKDERWTLRAKTRRQAFVEVLVVDVPTRSSEEERLVGEDSDGCAVDVLASSGRSSPR
jgi:hypothetical protein